MNKSIPAFSILRTPENAEEINKVANEWMSKNGSTYILSGTHGVLEFNGSHFYFVHDSTLYPLITLDQFREYFSVKKQYTLPDGDVVSEGDEVWYYHKYELIIVKCNINKDYILQELDGTSQLFSTREKCEQALNEYKLKLAAERYPKDCKFTSASKENNTKWICSGKFNVDSRSEYKGNIINEDGGCIYNASTNQWAEIVPSEQKQPISYRCPFEFKYEETLYKLGTIFKLDEYGDLHFYGGEIPTEIAIRAGFEPIYEVEKTPLEQAIALLKRTTEYDVLDEWKKKVTELEQLIKK